MYDAMCPNFVENCHRYDSLQNYTSVVWIDIGVIKKSMTILYVLSVILFRSKPRKLLWCVDI